MERQLESVGAQSSNRNVALHGEAIRSLTTPEIARTNVLENASVKALPSADNLLKELTKDTKLASSAAKNPREQQTATENSYWLKRDLAHLKPEDLKVVSETAAALQAEKTLGKPCDVVKHLNELTDLCHGDKTKARALWNATMLEMARENHTSVNLIQHSRWFDNQTTIHDPFTHVLLTDRIP